MKGQHTGARLAIELEDMIDRFEITDGGLLGIRTGNASSNYSMRRNQHSGPLQSSGLL